jgi:hypothetical protein
MIKKGRLTISAGFSRLGSTRLMKGQLDNDGFGRATDFLEQDRQLNSGQRIFVDGEDREFDGANVILITDAGPSTGAALGLAGPRRARKSGKKAQKRSAAKSKKSAKKQSGKKKRAKKSVTKKR